MPMKNRYTSYFIKTSDNQQLQIDSHTMEELSMQELDKDLASLLVLHDPSDEVLGRLFSTIAQFDAM